MFDGLGRPFHMDGFCRTGQAARSGYEGAKKDVPTETCIVSVVMNIKRDLNCMISLTDIRFIILLSDCYLLLCRWARKNPTMPHLSIFVYCGKSSFQVLVLHIQTLDIANDIRYL